MQKFIFFVPVLFLYFAEINIAFSQNNVTHFGNYIVDRFNASEYMGHSQNWDISQDSSGRMYFGNSNGLMVYNGKFWRSFGVRNNSIVRAFHLYKNKVYVGAQNEFGYFEADTVGKLHYHSLSELISDTTLVFNDIWTVNRLDSSIYFQASNYIFKFTAGKIEIIKAKGSFNAVYEVENKLFVNDFGDGLYEFTNSTKNLIIKADDNFKVRIYFVLPKKKGTVWIGTREKGIFEYNGQNLIPIKTEADEYLNTNLIYLSSKYNASTFMINTLRGGLVLLDTTGHVKRIFTKKDGLNDDAIYNSFADREGNIWLAHENGISRIDINSPITILEDEQYITSLPSALLKYQNKLIFAVNSGLFSYESKTHNPINTATGNFSSYMEESNRIWSIEYLNGKLFLAGQGLILIKDSNKEYKIFDDIFVWNISPVVGHTDKYWVFTQAGIRRLEWINNSWKLSRTLDGFNINSRYSTVDKNGHIWVAENFKGIFRVIPDENLNIAKVKNYGKEQGIKNLNTPRCIALNGTPYVSSGTDVLVYEQSTDRFNKVQIYSDFSDSINSDLVFRYAQKDGSGIWCNYASQVAFFYKKNDSLFLQTQAFKTIPKIYLFPTFYSDSTELFVGYPKQVYRIDKTFKKNYKQDFKILITQVSDLKSDTIFIDEFISMPESLNLELDYKYNSLRFNYAAPYFQQSQSTEYSYMLVGEDESWSQFTTSVYKDYTNLSEGNYIFLVKARNVFGVETEPAVIQITINPPFYRHMLAYFAYVLLGISLIYVIVKFNTRKLKRTNAQLEKRVEMRTQKIFEQKEELAKQNTELKKLSAIASETSNAVSVFDAYGNLEWVNDGFTKMYGYSKQDYCDAIGAHISGCCPTHIVNAILTGSYTEFENFSFEIQRQTNYNTKLWIKSTLTLLFNEAGNLANIIAIDTDISELKNAESIIINAKDEIQAQRDELIHQNKYILLQNEHIESAIRYAKTIQDAILPPKSIIDSLYDNFIIYLPKEIVSGDFYWFHSHLLEHDIELKLNDETGITLKPVAGSRLDFFVVADCTGHGVPGAFMSLIGIQLFTEIIVQRRCFTPSQILNLLNNEIKEALKQNVSNNADGMDASLCLIIRNKEEEGTLVFSGSKRPFYKYDAANGSLLKVKGDTNNIGGNYSKHEAIFTDFTTHFSKDDVIYMCSDGYIDQNARNRKRYGSPKFELMLTEIAGNPLDKQKEILLHELELYMENQPQRDDITVLGIKMHK